MTDSNTSSQFSVEPTDLFIQKALPLIRQWEGGTLSAGNTLQALDALRQLPEVQAEPANLAQLEQMAGVIYGSVNRLAEGIQTNRIAIDLFRKVGNLRLALVSELNVAEIRINQSDVQAGLGMYRHILEEARRAKLLSIEARTLTNMAAAFIELESWNEARLALEQAEPIMLQIPRERSNIHSLICHMYRDLVMAYVKLNQLERAWQTARTLTEFAGQRDDDIAAQAHAQVATADVLAALENYPEADAILGDSPIGRDPIPHYQTAIDHFLKRNDEFSAAVALCQYAQCLASKGQYMNGARKAEHASKLFKKLHMEREQTRATALRAKLISRG